MSSIGLTLVAFIFLIVFISLVAFIFLIEFDYLVSYTFVELKEQSENSFLSSGLLACVLTPVENGDMLYAGSTCHLCFHLN